MQFLTFFVFLSNVFVCVNVFVWGYVAPSPSGTGEGGHVGWWGGGGRGGERETGVMCSRVYVLRNLMITKKEWLRWFKKKRTFLVNMND